MCNEVSGIMYLLCLCEWLMREHDDEKHKEKNVDHDAWANAMATVYDLL